jgi:hypothetical protein
MSRRDYRHREPKKPKKDTKKLAPVDIMPPAANVEVVKKRKKQKEGEEER